MSETQNKPWKSDKASFQSPKGFNAKANPICVCALARAQKSKQKNGCVLPVIKWSQMSIVYLSNFAATLLLIFLKIKFHFACKIAHQITACARDRPKVAARHLIVSYYGLHSMEHQMCGIFFWLNFHYRYGTLGKLCSLIWNCN